MSHNTSAAGELRSQWQNPGDIFSLLLLVGGDVVQKAIARLVGVHAKVLGTGQQIYFTPVAFSFGWVTYAFISLASMLGDHRLMPEPDTGILVINCNNGYVRDNYSWVLGRIVRDKEYRIAELTRTKEKPKNAQGEIDSTGEVSLAIDLFVAEASNVNGPRKGRAWYIHWLVILLQQVIAAIPWIIWNDWSVFMITASGTFLAVVTAGLPQWPAEKWTKKLDKSNKDKTVALTRGNGHQYVMLILCHEGAWDLEAMASGRQRVVTGTKFFMCLFSLLWIVLLITVTGLKEHTWLLIGVGGLGMLQNVIVAARPSKPEDFDISLVPYSSRATITGYQYVYEKKKDIKERLWKNYTAINAKDEFDNKLEEGKVRDVMGALIELEKHHKGAGAALVPVFFPGALEYGNSSALNNPREKLFWNHAAEPNASPGNPR